MGEEHVIKYCDKMLTALKKGGKEWLVYYLVRVYFSCMHEALIDHHLTFFADRASWKTFSKRMSGHECCCNVALLEKF